MKLPNDPLPVGVMSLKDVNLHTLQLEAEAMRLEAIRQGILCAAVNAGNRKRWRDFEKWVKKVTDADDD